jgi:hypothetical protein
MAVDFLRAGYEIYMRTHPDFDPVPVIWYRVPDDTPFIEEPSCFRSRYWLDRFDQPNVGMGEQRPWSADCCQMIGPFVGGSSPVPYLGGNHCGSEDDWEQGPPPDTPPIITQPGGWAPCCTQICED